jgi:hypothetical protein
MTRWCPSSSQKRAAAADPYARSPIKRRGGGWPAHAPPPNGSVSRSRPATWRSKARAFPGQRRQAHRARGGHALPLILADANFLLYVLITREPSTRPERRFPPGLPGQPAASLSPVGDTGIWYAVFYATARPPRLSWMRLWLSQSCACFWSRTSTSWTGLMSDRPPTRSSAC